MYCLILPNWRVQIKNSQLAARKFKLIFIKCFCKNVWQLHFCRNITWMNFTCLKFFPSYVTINLNVFCTWKTRSVAICKVAWLSQNNEVDLCNSTFKSQTIYLNQANYRQVFVIALYSSSTDERDTFVCFFDFQEMSDDPRKTQ